jgi:dipeptidyl aminopeptidase/acylaminoacyl peptidase
MQSASDTIVAAMRKNNLSVQYVVYPDEGHGLARPDNNLDFMGRVEEFLAEHLDGRKQPWVEIQGSSAEVR